MATHSSILAWRIPWAEEPGGLRSIVLRRVRHKRSNLARSMHALYVKFRFVEYFKIIDIYKLNNLKNHLI